MLADDMACDPRNPRPGTIAAFLILSLSLLFLSATIFNDVNQQINVYGDDIEVDYRGYEVGVTSTHAN